jgi:hypothetical protein
MANFTYKSYQFINKDPIIDKIRTVVDESGANYKWIEDSSGVSAITLRNWFYGSTKKPQAATVNAVLRCLGYELGIVNFGQAVKIVPVMPRQEDRMAKHDSVRHVVQMHKYRRKEK